ncbi:hypothetical protein GWI33_008426 [Rhynchophorus ferrugineus]|uniref:Uncharacterized protein n=1 Tax=Rhynchophorus ferrugineus TaxID=354439 RepID=A0A834IGP2_RHYFE|nr:hypothetical protein GWI33_008426 [Rhynchophorus ferrugineus]
MLPKFDPYNSNWDFIEWSRYAINIKNKLGVNLHLMQKHHRDRPCLSDYGIQKFSPPPPDYGCVCLSTYYVIMKLERQYDFEILATGEKFKKIPPIFLKYYVQKNANPIFLLSHLEVRVSNVKKTRHRQKKFTLNKKIDFENINSSNNNSSESRSSLPVCTNCNKPVAQKYVSLEKKCRKTQLVNKADHAVIIKPRNRDGTQTRHL